MLFASTSIAQDTIKEIEIVNPLQSWPVFNGRIDEFIKENLIYPEKAINDSIEGLVYTTFYVDTLGLTVNHKVAKGIRDDLNNEALRIVKLIKFDKPAQQNGKPIKVLYTLPVKFELCKSSRKGR
jgi:protein TonB